MNRQVHHVAAAIERIRKLRAVGEAGIRRQVRDAILDDLAEMHTVPGEMIDRGLPIHAWKVWEPLLTGAEKIGPL